MMSQSRKNIAMFEMFLMIFSTVAISFLIGQSIGIVSAGVTYGALKVGDKYGGEVITKVATDQAGMVKIYGANQKDPLAVADGSLDIKGTSFEQISTAPSIAAPTAPAKVAPKIDPTTGFGATIPAVGTASTTAQYVKIEGNWAKVVGTDKAVYADGSSKPIDLAAMKKNTDYTFTDAKGAGVGGLTQEYWGNANVDMTKVNAIQAKIQAGQADQLTVQQFKDAGIDVKSVSTNGDKLYVTDAGGTTRAFDSTGALTGTTKETKSELFGMKFTGAMSHLMTGLQWSLFVVGAIQVLGRLFGASDNLVNALSVAAFAGIMAWKGILAVVEQTKWAGGQTGWLWNSAGFIGIGIGAAVFLMMYKEEKQKIVQFTCQPWQAPLGGVNCEKCNGDKFRPCSEYRCRALGQACQLLNAGTGNETCAWVSKFDVNSPKIQPSTDVLRPFGLVYVEDTSVRPPALGVKIVNKSRTDGCLAAFTPLQFGIMTNEPSQCKIDYTHTKDIKDMQFFLGESNLFEYNHTQLLRLPAPAGPNSTGLPQISNDGTYSWYVRCQDANGNQNVDEYSVSYCIDPSPDTTPPIIESTSIASGNPVRYGADSVPIDVYTNELASCRWSRIDMSYDDMTNNMSCNNYNYQVNANLQYTCSGNLTAITDRTENKFFFRCKDTKGNVNAQSYPLILKGSQPLDIIRMAPNGTIYGSTTTTTINLQVETSNGASDGKALCYYYTASGLNTSLDSTKYIQMFETNKFVSKQSLDLSGGDYRTYFRCLDEGGNVAENYTSFTAVVDKQAPIVSRVYRELPDALKVVTNEDAQCSYSLTTCNFNVANGIAMLYSSPDNKEVNLAKWKAGQTYYVKCKDFYGNEPSTNQCSIIVGATQISNSN